MVLRIGRSESPEAIVFVLSGRIELQDIDRLAPEIRAYSKPVTIDMREVTLVEREAIGTLVQWEEEKITLRNCPAYVREWMSQARSSK